MAKETKRPGVPASAAPTHDWSQSSVTGLENVNQEDLGIPFLGIIQKGSPQFDSDHKYHATKGIDGCSVGDIFNTVSNTVIAEAGQEIEVIPCSYQKLFMEWTPREKGGGLVKTHRDASILNECQRNERGQDVLRSGNLIVTTAYFYCIALIEGERIPCMIGLTSTQLKKAKQWLNMITSLKLAKPDGTKYTPPAFSHSYKLSTVTETNAQGSWRGWVIKIGSMITDAVLIADAMGYAKRAVTIQQQLNAPPVEDKGDAHLA